MDSSSQFGGSSHDLPLNLLSNILSSMNLETNSMRNVNSSNNNNQNLASLRNSSNLLASNANCSTLFSERNESNESSPFDRIDLKSIFNGDNHFRHSNDHINDSKEKSLIDFMTDSSDLNHVGSSNLDQAQELFFNVRGSLGSNSLLSNEPQARKLFQSLSQYGFSNSSNSSSPPSSQTTGTSSSSLHEVINSSPIKPNSRVNQINRNHSVNSPKLCSQKSSNNFNNNLSSQLMKNHSLLTKKDALFQPNNLLDNAFDSLLSQKTLEAINNQESITEISSLLNDTSFSSSEKSVNSSLKQQPQIQKLSSYSNQQNLFQNTKTQNSNSSIFSVASNVTPEDPFNNNLPNSRKKVPQLFFNNDVSTNSTNLSTASNLSSPTISNSLFQSSNISDSSSTSNNSTITNNSASTLNSNFQLQARFDYHIRLIANEINSTVQLYLNSIQMRKEHLLKQLDHVRNTYTLMLSQNNESNNKNKNSSPVLQLPKIAFIRPDQNLFKSITSFGFINAPAFAPYCQTSGEGLTVAIEGEPTCFSISMRNCFNEEISTGGDSVDIDIQPIEPKSQFNLFSSNSLLIQKNILDNNNGKYSITYMIPRGSGLRNIEIFVNINGINMTNSPFIASIKTERLRENWKLIALFGEEGCEPGKFCRPWGVTLARLPFQKDPNHKRTNDSNSVDIPINSKPFYNWTCSPLKREYLCAVADRSNNRIQLLKLSIPDDLSFNQNVSAQMSNLNMKNKVDISVLHVFGSGPGTRPGQFDRPAGLAINSNLGQIIVADKDNHRVQVFDLTGMFLFKFGEKGSRLGQFCYPWDVAVCPQTSMILVSDTRNRRIQLFTHFGQYVWHCGQPLDSPRGVAFLSVDRFIISDFNKHRLLVVDRNEIGSHNNVLNHRDQELIASKYIGFGEGSAWGEFLRPQGLVAIVNKSNTGSAKHAQILCADSRNNRIAIYNSSSQNFEYINDDVSKVETLSNILISFDRPSGIAICDNILVVVDFGNNRVQIFQKNSA